MYDTNDLYDVEETSKCLGFLRLLWKFFRCIFSHVTLVSLVVAYCVLGAYAFESLEAAHEIEVKESIKYVRSNVTRQIWIITENSEVLIQENWTDKVVEELIRFEKQLLEKMKKDGWDGIEEVTNIQWTFAGALFYSIIVITTIGYGHIAPKTQNGKVVTIFYAILGIPLMLLCLSNIGDVMASSFRFVYWKICCYVCTRPPKPRRAAARHVVNAVLTTRSQSLRQPGRYGTTPTVLPSSSSSSAATKTAGFASSTGGSSSLRRAISRFPGNQSYPNYSHGIHLPTASYNENIMTRSSRHSDNIVERSNRYMGQHRSSSDGIAPGMISTSSSSSPPTPHRNQLITASPTIIKVRSRSSAIATPSTRSLDRKFQYVSSMNADAEQTPVLINKYAIDEHGSANLHVPADNLSDIILSSFAGIEDATNTSDTTINPTTTTTTTITNKNSNRNTNNGTWSGMTIPPRRCRSVETSRPVVNSAINNNNVHHDDEINLRQTRIPSSAVASSIRRARSNARLHKREASSARIMSPMGFAVHRQIYIDDIDLDHDYLTSNTDEPDGSSTIKPVPIWLCVFLVVSYILGGAFLFAEWETWPYLDSAYFCFITLTTIGFGDLVPAHRLNAHQGIALCSLYLLFGIALLAMSFNLVQEEVINNVKNVAKRLGILKEDHDIDNDDYDDDDDGDDDDDDDDGEFHHQGDYAFDRDYEPEYNNGVGGFLDNDGPQRAFYPTSRS